MILRSPLNRKLLTVISAASLSFGMICCNSSNAPTAPKSRAMAQARSDYSGTWVCSGSGCEKNESFQMMDDLKTIKVFTTKTLNTGVDCDVEQDNAVQSKSLRGKSASLNLVAVPGKFQLVTAEMDPNPNPSAEPSSTPSSAPSETPASEVSECQVAIGAANSDLGAKPVPVIFELSLDSKKQILSMGYAADTDNSAGPAKQYTKKK